MHDNGCSTTHGATTTDVESTQCDELPAGDVVLPDGVSQVDFDARSAGREKGQLTQDELIDALHAWSSRPRC